MGDGIKLGEDKIEAAEHSKYLGVFLDNRLDFKKYAEYISRKIVQNVGVMRRINNKVDRSTALKIYKVILGTSPFHVLCYSIIHATD